MNFFLPTFGPCLRYKLGLTNSFHNKSPAHFGAICAVGLQRGRGAQKQAASREDHDDVHQWCHLQITSTFTVLTHTNVVGPFRPSAILAGRKLPYGFTLRSARVTRTSLIAKSAKQYLPAYFLAGGFWFLFGAVLWFSKGLTSSYFLALRFSKIKYHHKNKKKKKLMKERFIFPSCSGLFISLILENAFLRFLFAYLSHFEIKLH